MLNRKEIEKFVNSTNKELNNMDKVFENEVKKTQKEFAKKVRIYTNRLEKNHGSLLNNSLNRKIANESLVKLNNELRDLGYGKLVRGRINRDYNQIVKLTEKYYVDVLGKETKFLQADIKSIDAYRKADFDELNIKGRDVSNTVRRNIIGSVLGRDNFNEFQNDLLNQIEGDEERSGLLQRNVNTWARTALDVFNRRVDTVRAERIGLKQYVYIGILDGKTRPFCIRQIRQTIDNPKTKKQIQQLNNGQLSNPFVTGGGWNCRHKWKAVA